MSKQYRLSVITGLLLALTFASGVAAAQDRDRDRPKTGTPADEATIRQIVAQQAEAWNRGDAKTWSKDFAENADFTNIFGTVFSGRKEIENRHAAIFASMFKGSASKVTVRRIAFLSPRLALVDTDHVVTGHGTLPPTLHAVDGALRTRMKYVMQRGANGWQIVAAQNTDIKPQPAKAR